MKAYSASKKEKDPLRIALQRIVTAMGRRPQTDAAIDLGIAI